MYDAGVDFDFIYLFLLMFVNGGKQHLMSTGIERTGKGIIKSIMGGNRHQRGWMTVDC